MSWKSNDDEPIKMHIVELKYLEPMCILDGTYGFKLNEKCLDCQHFSFGDKHCKNKALARQAQKITSCNSIEFTRNEYRDKLRLDKANYNDIKVLRLVIDGRTVIEEVEQENDSNIYD